MAFKVKELALPHHIDTLMKNISQIVHLFIYYELGNTTVIVTS